MSATEGLAVDDWAADAGGFVMFDGFKRFLMQGNVVDLSTEYSECPSAVAVRRRAFCAKPFIEVAAFKRMTG